MLNQCNFIGNLGKDPETRQLNDGSTVAKFSIACTERWKDKSGQQQEKTEWVNMVAFRQLADICAQYLTKGSKVYASGKMRTRKWQDNEGMDKYTTEVVLSDMKMLTPKSEGGGSQSAQRGSQEPQRGQQRTPQAAYQEQQTTANDFADFDDGEIPF